MFPFINCLKREFSDSSNTTALLTPFDTDVCCSSGTCTESWQVKDKNVKKVFKNRLIVKPGCFHENIFFRQKTSPSAKLH